MCPLPFDYFSNHLKYLTRPRLHHASWWRIHEVNNTHKVTRKPFPVISIGGDLQGSHNTICCPQCQRRWQTGIIYIGHCSCMSTCVYMCVYMCVYCQTSLHLTRSPRTSSSIFAYCKEWRGEWHGNGLGIRLGQPLQELNVQYTFRVVFLAVGTDLQWMQYSTALQDNSTTWLFQPIID